MSTWVSPFIILSIKKIKKKRGILVNMELFFFHFLPQLLILIWPMGGSGDLRAQLEPSLFFTYLRIGFITFK
jgi:hypothetical protein